MQEDGLKGGQGRTDQDIADAGAAIEWCAVAVVVVFVVQALAHLM